MAYEMRPNQGSLFRNKEMRTDKKDPNLTGKIMLPDGSTHWVSGWTKTTTAGEKWISLNIGNPVFQSGGSEPAQAAPIVRVELDDDIPF